MHEASGDVPAISSSSAFTRCSDVLVLVLAPSFGGTGCPARRSSDSRLLSWAWSAVICRRTSHNSRVAACAADPREVGTGVVDAGLDVTRLATFPVRLEAEDNPLDDGFCVPRRMADADEAGAINEAFALAAVETLSPVPGAALLARLDCAERNACALEGLTPAFSSSAWIFATPGCAGGLAGWRSSDDMLAGDAGSIFTGGCRF